MTKQQKNIIRRVLEQLPVPPARVAIESDLASIVASLSSVPSLLDLAHAPVVTRFSRSARKPTLSELDNDASD